MMCLAPGAPRTAASLASTPGRSALCALAILPTSAPLQARGGAAWTNGQGGRNRAGSGPRCSGCLCS
eukprot:8268004-Pyramimonas_sp.AAC.1